ncbi:maleylpyruvate isomerase family mycothiol-dependent enzyme [Amycolatopsis sp. NPDC051903]|uniref:maleylpyruvate isomerase family mycothiol-dependent enzyme n=1 Tax=Amycolatopsis sp. NPDC051903 TaxID=3363936 RepID=UPI0037B51676
MVVEPEGLLMEFPSNSVGYRELFVASSPLTAAVKNSRTWLAALTTSSERLVKAVIDLSSETLDRPSATGDWTIAQVLSHLGSAAEICTTLVQRGIEGDLTGPDAELVKPVWQRWDTMTGPAQREAWFEVDLRHRELLGSLDAEQLGSVRVPYFAGLLTVGEYAGYRLSEQSVHAWDIEVALDSAARIPISEVVLLWERLDLVVTRFRSGEVLERLAPRQLAVQLPDLEGPHTLDLGEELHLTAEPTAASAGTLSGSAEEMLRLVYGRNRAEDGLDVTGDVTLEQLRALFPGY